PYLLFNESQSRIIITASKRNSATVLSLLEWRGVPARRIGSVGGKDLQITLGNGVSLVWSIAELNDAWAGSIARIME
nr:hypothetical protein [Verrucomicrobiota bacterium]